VGVGWTGEDSIVWAGPLVEMEAVSIACNCGMDHGRTVRFGSSARLSSREPH
jgi:hypothetical protein